MYLKNKKQSFNIGSLCTDLQVEQGLGNALAGATGALRAHWIPVFVLDHPTMPDRSKLMRIKVSLVFPHPFQENPFQLKRQQETQSVYEKQETFSPGYFRSGTFILRNFIAKRTPGRKSW